ncbi:MAG: phytanoyl-CoA dioxygenase family protein [Acidobacteriota bacterium]
MGQPEYGKETPGNYSVAYAGGTPLREIQKHLPLRVLSPKDWQHWITWGFLIVSDAVPPTHVRRTVDILWEFTELDRDDPSTWERDQLAEHEMKELNNSGMVEIYNHQALWDNRQYPRVYEAFVDIWDTERLWVTIDRANLNTPNRGRRAFSGFLHWDYDTTLDPLPVSVQGVLALVDTAGEMGGFQCVPELFKDFDAWRRSQPPDRDPWHPDLTGYEVQQVPMQAGDLLIFNSLLAHGIRPNLSNRPRIAQYISMTPAQEENLPLRQERVRSWRERLPPQGFAFPGDPRRWEQTRYPTARLTPLGKKLLGLESWA